MGYPRWWNKTITIYNRYFDSDRIPHYKRTVIDKCFFKREDNIITNNQQNQTLHREYIVRIPENEMYVEWIRWNAYPMYGFTIQTDDIVVLGEVYDEIDETVNGKRANDLLNKYKSNAFTVKNYMENLYINPKHYYISGE